jgi:hypothetical protein
VCKGDGTNDFKMSKKLKIKLKILSPCLSFHSLLFLFAKGKTRSFFFFFFSLLSASALSCLSLAAGSLEDCDEAAARGGRVQFLKIWLSSHQSGEMD